MTRYNEYSRADTWRLLKGSKGKKERTREREREKDDNGKKENGEGRDRTW